MRRSTRAVGRDAEVEWLRGATSGAGVIAVHGPAGVGKSALVSAALADRAPILLSPSRSDGAPRLAQRLRVALGATPGRGSPVRAALEQVRERPGTIVVLDGPEAPPRAAVTFAAQLAEAGAMVVLVARELVGTGAESRLAVRPFVVPPVEALRDAPVLEVWTELARRIRPDYAVGASDLPLVHAILARLDGLPLAMSLVAPRLAALDHATILRELEDSAHDGPLAAVTRALATSLRTLGKRERDALAFAATFPGTFDAARLHELWPGRRGTLHAALQSLVERSWLVAEEPAGSLRMLGVVREFVRARERARIAELDRAFADAQATAAAALGEEAERCFAIEPIRARADDLLHAAEIAVRQRRVDAAVPPLAALGHLVQLGTAPPALAERTAAALALARRRADRARLLWVTLVLERSVAGTASVVRRANEVLATAGGVPFVRGAALHVLGSIGIEAGDPNAERHLERARALFAGWASEEALVLVHLAIHAQRRGELPLAIARLREATTIARRHGSPRATATAASVLGAVLAEHGDASGAERALDEAMRLASASADRRTEAYAATCRGEALVAAGEPTRAVPYFERAIELFHACGAASYRAFARQALGVAHALGGDRTAARAELERALAELAASGYATAAIGEAHLAVLDAEEGFRDLARERLARGRRAAPEFAGLARIVEAFLDGRTAPGDALTSDERLLRRRVEALLLREGRIAVAVASDGATFRTGDTVVHLGSRPQLRRVLAALARAKGTTLSPDELRAEAWPGERTLRPAALNRLYVTVRRLRELGLATAIESVDGGYRLVPSTEVVATITP